jgi:branched-chain amino acid transport system ATP-binding protein
MTEPILQVKDIHCSYDEVPVLHGISAQVYPGELVAVIGANGAGKSTLMKTIIGLMHPRKGSITFAGQNITGLPAHQTLQLGICYVPEGRRLFPKLTVMENLELGAYIEKDRSLINSRLDEIYELFPILKKRSRQIAETLSGGEQQMLAIARGMMSKPKLLMLDEMSLGLMPTFVEKMMDTVSEVNKNGTTVLLVEQMVQEALEIAHRAYVIQTGQVVTSGNSQDLLASEDIRKAYLGM